MSKIHVTSEMPQHLAKGLQDGRCERVGGAICDVESKQILAWLREASEIGAPIVSEFLSATVSVSTQANLLNLAISTMGFALVMKRLNSIEQQLKQAQEDLNDIDYKIDLSFYANFRAALDLATNTFTMANPETRRVSALQAINRFLEAEHQYTNLVDTEIANGSQVADDYLTTLYLAYVTEVRCYLELEELDTAHQRMQEGLSVLKPRFEKHIDTLLTSNPAAYLHPSLKDRIDLKRLTKVYRWLDPGIDEAAMFEAQRENLFKLASHPEEWISSLPQAIYLPKKGRFLPKDLAKQFEKFRKLDFPKQFRDLRNALPSMSRGLRDSLLGTQETDQSNDSGIYGRLPHILELIESMIENYNRFKMYSAETQTIRQLGISFQDWRHLAPPAGVQKNGSDINYITVFN
ncbi:hypothetical protein L0337_38355 [candidate division KSB1 bacterium]|nr:hypothetical protein [candidate division KSB1 bacterium]